MVEEDPSQAPLRPDEQETLQKPERHRRRWPWIVAAVVVAIAVVGYVAVSYAPQYIARYLARTYFQGLAIDTDGVETIEINPLRGRIGFGPVSFRGSGEQTGQAGQVGRIEVQVNLRRLLSRQALIESAEIEGIRIDIRQAADGAISINGVPLTQILADQAARAEEEEEAKVEEDAEAWGAGLDTLRLRDSRVVFTDARGGEAVVEVNELELQGFATWAPDDPGRFLLDGDLNQVHVAMSGTARPFADSITVDAQLSVTGIEAGKLELFAGPLGLDRDSGRIDVTVDTTGSKVLSDGRVDAKLAGKVDFNGIDLAHTDFGGVELKTGALNLDDIHLQYDVSGTIQLAGNAALDLESLGLRLKDGIDVGVDSAHVGLPALSALLPPSDPPSLKIAPQLDARALRLGTKWVEGTVDRVALQLPEFDVDTRAPEMPMTATGTLEVGGLALLLPLKKPIRIGAGSADLALNTMRFAFGPDSTMIDGEMALDLSDVNFAVTKHGDTPDVLLPLVEITAGKLAGRLSPLTLDDQSVATKVKVAGPSLVLDDFRLAAPVAPGSTMSLVAPDLDLRSTDIDVLDGATLDVSGHSRVGAPQFTVEMGGAESAPSSVELADLALDPKHFAYREQGPNSSLEFQGNIEAAGTAARLAGGADGLASLVDLGRLRVSVDDAAMDIDNPDPQWHAQGLDLALASLSAAVPGELATLLDIKDFDLVRGTAASRGEYTVDQVAIGRVDASLTRRSGGDVSAEQAPAPTSKKAETEEEEEKPAARTWPPEDLPVIRIGRFGLLDGAKITVSDETRSPPATTVAQIRSLALENVDTTDPAARSSLRLAALLDDAELNADGWALPFQPKPDFELRANVNELRLPSVNPYVGPEVGLDVVNGRLTARADARAEDGQLKGEIRARVVDLGFADRPEAGSDRISQSVGVPLTTIVELLQDADGSIDLTLPFEGDLLSPEFDYSEMLWSGLFRVLRALIVAPFKLISASMDLAAARREKGEASGASAPPGPMPIAFAPGAATIPPEAKGMLAGMQQVMTDHPRMRLTLCGVATPADGTALGLLPAPATATGTATAAPTATTAPLAPTPEDEAKARPALLDLAGQRMRAVQTALIEGGIAPSRLPLCAEPAIAAADSGPPRVEFGF